MITRRFVLLASVFLAGAVGEWNDTSTGIDLDELPHFPVKTIRSGWLKVGSHVTFDGITATGADAFMGDVQLRGVGKSGKRWEAHMCCLDEVWRADLDGNGTQDYIFTGSGPYLNGRTTPLFSMSILLMDAQGMPVPFFTSLYHGENGKGIKHLVDFNRDGRAELLISSYDENTSDPRVGPLCSGHWTTQLYRFKNLGTEELHGVFGGLRLPFIHAWTYRGTKCTDEGGPFYKVEPPDLAGKGTIREVTTTIREVKEPGFLKIDPVEGCKEVQAATIVYDRPNIREIAFPTMFSDYNGNLARAISRDRVPAKLRGLDKLGDGNCSANLIWAGQ